MIVFHDSFQDSADFHHDRRMAKFVCNHFHLFQSFFLSPMKLFQTKSHRNLVLCKVDFGSEVGVRKSSAQITHYYNSDNLVGKQVIGVCNFPKKNIAGIVSEVLILGAIEKDGKVVLVHPSQKTENGLEIA